MLVESWPLSASMWDGDVLAGPIPTLFAEDADLSSEAFASDPAKAHGGGEAVPGILHARTRAAAGCRGASEKAKGGGSPVQLQAEQVHSSGGPSVPQKKEAGF